MTSLLLHPAVFALLGLVIGSYLNVAAFRIPRRLSTWSPPSTCPACGRRIRAWENVPAVSYVVLAGRCHGCRQPISWRYPLTEVVTGLTFTACAVQFPTLAERLGAVVFASFLIVLARTDAELFLLPDRITYPGIGLGLLISSLVSDVGLLPALLGAALGAGALSLVILIWWLRFRELAMGWGDVKMMALIGAFLGPADTFVSFALAAATGSLVGLLGLVTHRLRGRAELPFGVFLSLGALTTLFFGDPLVDWYWRLSLTWWS